jgi:hypothetical protein
MDVHKGISIETAKLYFKDPARINVSVANTEAHATNVIFIGINKIFIAANSNSFMTNSSSFKTNSNTSTTISNSFAAITTLFGSFAMVKITKTMAKESGIIATMTRSDSYGMKNLLPISNPALSIKEKTIGAAPTIDLGAIKSTTMEIIVGAFTKSA